MDDRYRNTSQIKQRAITERAREVTFQGESPNEEWMGEVEIMCDRDGNMSLHVKRSSIKKYTGKKWHSESVYLTLTREAWEHLRAAPVEMPGNTP